MSISVSSSEHDETNKDIIREKNIYLDIAAFSYLYSGVPKVTHLDPIPS